MMNEARNMDVNSLIQRLRRLATLDTTVLDEVRTDTSQTLPAVVVVIVSTLLSGLGGWLWWIFSDYSDSGEFFFKSVIIGSILSVGLWFVWVGITYVMLNQVFSARADAWELVRVMGFAAAPLGLSIVMFIPMLEFGLALASIVLFFGFTVIAVQSATDAPAGKALVATAAGFAVWALVLFLLVSDENILAPGIFIFDFGVEYLRR